MRFYYGCHSQVQDNPKRTNRIHEFRVIAIKSISYITADIKAANDLPMNCVSGMANGDVWCRQWGNQQICITQKSKTCSARALPNECWPTLQPVMLERILGKVAGVDE